MKNFDHYLALSDRLARAQGRYATDPSEWRRRAVEEAKRELAQEERFLGMAPATTDLSDDDLARELGLD